MDGPRTRDDEPGATPRARTADALRGGRSRPQVPPTDDESARAQADPRHAPPDVESPDAPFDPRRALARLVERRAEASLRHVHREPPRSESTDELPPWVCPPLAAALTGAGLGRLWSHQREAAEAVHAGEHVVLATGTASGKSLGYLVPVLSDLLDGSRAPTGRGASALYLAPTKALAHDQLARLHALALPGLRVATYDGDTPSEERRWVREHAAYVLTNPDLLHQTLLPGHEHWASFLRALTYVVVDECHVYRGIFGSHVALVLRRLRRVCARYRATPVFVFASATTGSSAEHATALLGMPVRALTTDTSPRASATVALWEPVGRRSGAASTPDGPRGRPSTLAESAEILADLVAQGAQTVAFARSRVGVETMAGAARRRLGEADTPGAAPVLDVAAYRGGFLPEERRALEDRLRSGRLRGLAATAALELGVDIAGLDAVVVAGWPGTRASFRQQIGRAGRRGRESLAILVAGEDPLDAYLVRHPEAIFGEPAEAAVVDPGNPYVLGAHLVAAAAELPLTDADVGVFGPTMPDLLADLVDQGVLRRRPAGWFWTGPHSPAGSVRLRAAVGSVRVVEQGTGRVLGHVDATRADATVHPGAVYLHQGSAHVVVGLDQQAGVALVLAGDPGWTTQARSVAEFGLADAVDGVEWRDGAIRGGIYRGSVEIRSRVVSFVRRDPWGSVLGEHPLDLPERTMVTQAVWWTIEDGGWSSVGVDDGRLPGALHAAEHAAIGLLPLVVTVDRWDVGGVSTPCHPDTGTPTVLVYDGVPGGAGFAAAGYAHAVAWLTATTNAVRTCPCATGCPSCIQSPKCGNGNHPLDKSAAATLLQHLSKGLGSRTGH
ncbi:MAG: DEAD/DEAH box helicase [Dermatophilaceae bacterium]